MQVVKTEVDNKLDFIKSLYTQNSEEIGVQEAMRADITTKFLDLYDETQKGVKRGSALHIEASIKILNSLCDLHGLKRPSRSKVEKVNTEIKLDWSSNMRD